ncbi:hypothetical protein KR059_007641, partial [Drosophila kikkawai]
NESSPRTLSEIFEDDILPMRRETRNLRYQPGGHKSQRPTTSYEGSSSSSSSFCSISSSVPTVPESSRWAIVFAKIVNIYKGYEPVDRMGLALSKLGDNEAATLILYKQKSLTMSHTKLKPNGNAIHLQDNYLQFYDDDRKYWSMRFVFEADEKEFIKMMTSNEWPLEQHVVTASEVEDSEEQQEQHIGQRKEQHREQRKEHQRESPSEHLAARSHTCNLHRHSRDNEEHQESPPQPKPRLRNLDCIRRHFMHLSCDHTQPSQEHIPEEDVIVTPISRPIGSTNSSLENHCNSANAVVTLNGQKADTYSSRLRQLIDTEEIDDSKMESILEAMKIVSEGHLKSIHDNEDQPKPQPRATTKLEDAEDRLLELEQILLDTKKHNRELRKALKRREKDMLEFQSSTIELMEKLIASKDELSRRNSRLMDTILGKANCEDKCLKCERSAQEIGFLKRHITALETALR